MTNINLNRTRIHIAKPDIERYFDELTQRIHRRKDIAEYLAEQRDFWRLAQSTTTPAFIKFLIEYSKLTEIVFPFPRPYKKETRYAWGDATLYEVMLTLKHDIYFSHYTAMMIHGLTEQLPKTTYLNQEQKITGRTGGELTQRGIDLAMQREVRTSSNVAETDDFRVCIVSGKNTGNYGVVEETIVGTEKPLGRLRFTRLERTLVDIVVRPVYAGGVQEVAKAFELAREKVSVNVLAATLEKLDYLYPYHQAIGYYLERAGYKPAQLDLLRRFPMKFDFYLAHGMKETQHVKEWRLHVPKGF